MATQMISNITITNGDVASIRASAIPMATVDSSSTSTAFTATVLGIKMLTDGACCWIRNNKVTSASGCTLNINSLGAKPIYISNAASTAVTTQWANGHTCLFVYNSSRVTNGCWDLVVGYDTNTTYSSKTAASGGTEVSLCTTGEKYTWNSKAAGSHTHGNITNGGALQTTDITIASGDKIVVTDASDSNKVARTSIAFDGSTTTQALTKKGTWGTFATSNTIPSAYCTTAATTAAKTASCTDYELTSNTWIHVIIKTASTVKAALTLAINSKTAKPIYINGTATSSSNYSLPAGSYLVYYDGTAYQFRTDGKLPGTALNSNKQYVEVYEPSTAQGFDIMFCDTSTTSSYSSIYKPPHGSLYLMLKSGTASSEGVSGLLVGNNIASGTVGNKYGILRLYSKGTNYVSMETATLTADHTLTLPNETGTVATREYINDLVGDINSILEALL